MHHVRSVWTVRHPWIGGYGLRWYGPKRWIYIVPGRDTVEVHLRQGGWRRLGTDDPQGLLKALTLEDIAPDAQNGVNLLHLLTAGYGTEQPSQGCPLMSVDWGATDLNQAG
jgi:hypothetical protein